VSIAVVAASRAAGVGRRHPGGRAGTAGLRSVRSHCRGDQGFFPRHPSRVNTTWGFAYDTDHAAGDRREEDPRLVQPCPAAPLRVGHGRRPPHARAPGRGGAGRRRRRSTPTSRLPEGARGAGAASTSVNVIRVVGISQVGACHARDRRASQFLVDAPAEGCASRGRLPGVRSSAAGGRHHCGRSQKVPDDVAKPPRTCGPCPLRLCESRYSGSYLTVAGDTTSAKIVHRSVLPSPRPRVRSKP